LSFSKKEFGFSSKENKFKDLLRISFAVFPWIETNLAALLCLVEIFLIREIDRKKI